MTAKYETEVFQNLVPTSHPDLFADENFELIHRIYGRIGHDARHLLTLPDGTVLRVFFGAPKIDEIGLTSAPLSSGLEGFGKLISLFAKFAKAAAPYLEGIGAGIEIIDLLTSLKDDTGPSMAAIEQKLNGILVATAAADYLDLMRRMADMRANALATKQTLAAVQNHIEGDRALSWYNTQLNASDRQLQTDINALLDDSEAYFRRVYAEQTIRGEDPNWLEAIPDRPNDGQGTMFEYRCALPTLMDLIAVRLVMMKMVVPNFVNQGTFAAELDRWGRRIIQLSSQMGNHVRMTPVTPLAVQASRRQTDGGQHIEEFRQWDQHCFVDPPRSISPIGAADITTGEHIIEWQFAQFDEYYLAQGDLRGGDAGYWPPSIGPEWYVPPVQAVGLPDLKEAEARYIGDAEQRAMELRQEVSNRMGGLDTEAFGWKMFHLAHPGAPF
jgi:hypothetical protein